MTAGKPKPQRASFLCFSSFKQGKGISNMMETAVPILWKHNSFKQNTQSLNILQFPHDVLLTSEIKINTKVHRFCAKQNKA